MTRLAGQFHGLQTKDGSLTFQASRKFQTMENSAAPAVHNEKRRSITSAVIHFDEGKELPFRSCLVDERGQVRDGGMSEEIVDGKFRAQFRLDPNKQANREERIAAEAKK